MLSVIVVSLLVLSQTIQAQYPNPVGCSGACGYVHDPYVIVRSDGTYFRFATFQKIQIASAPALTGPWTSEGPVLPDGSEIPLPGNMDLWAPDVHQIGDTYYLYYSVSQGGSQNSGIGLATSPTMESGTWEDHGSLGIPQSPEYNLIDPNLLIGPDGSYHLSFGSFWDDIFQIPMEDPADISNATAPYNLIYNATNTLHSVEGSFQFWWPTDGTVYYYMFFSSGACCNTPPKLAPPGEEYKIMVCRSTSLDGGFVDKDGVDCLTQSGGTLVLGSHDNVYAPGGQGVNYDYAQGLVIYYHYVDPTIGYEAEDFQFGFNYLNFDAGGWPFVSSTQQF